MSQVPPYPVQGSVIFHLTATVPSHLTSHFHTFHTLHSCPLSPSCHLPAQKPAYLPFQMEGLRVLALAFPSDFLFLLTVLQSDWSSLSL